MHEGVYLNGFIVYTACVTKRLVEIDDVLLARARAVARTNTIKATVETALQILVDRDIVLTHVARLRSTDALEADHLEDARRPRLGANA